MNEARESEGDESCVNLYQDDWKQEDPTQQDLDQEDSAHKIPEKDEESDEGSDYEGQDGKTANTLHSHTLVGEGKSSSRLNQSVEPEDSEEDKTNEESKKGNKNEERKDGKENKQGKEININERLLDTPEDSKIQKEDLEGSLVKSKGKRKRQEQKAFIRDLLEAHERSIQELSKEMKQYFTIDEFEINKPDKIERDKRETMDNIQKSVCFGDVIVLKVNNPDDEATKDAKITSFCSLSDRADAIEMAPEEFDDFCRFQILPAFEFQEQAKIEDMISSNKVTEDYKEVYENFLDEGRQNIDNYDELLGKPIKYGDKFQLYQITSRRYFCLQPFSQTILDTHGKGKPIDEGFKALGFSEHSSMMTHFSFEPSADYQKEEDHQTVKCYHDCYLTSEDNLKLYFSTLGTC